MHLNIPDFIVLRGYRMINQLANMAEKYRNHESGEEAKDLLIKKIYQNRQYVEQKKVKECEILFISPPVWDVHSPFSAVPCLVASLERDGVSCNQIDLGIMCFHIALVQYFDECSRKFFDKKYYMRFVETCDKNVYTSYEQYVADLWFFDDKERFIENVKKRYEELNYIQRGIVEVFYQDIYLQVSDYVDLEKEKDIHNTITPKCKNLIMQSIYEFGLVKMFFEAPPIVGISITTPAQLGSGCYIAQLLRAVRPDIKLIAGGSCIDLFLNSSYESKRDIFDYFDYLLYGEGETAFSQLYQVIVKQQYDKLFSVTNLVYMEHGKIHKNDYIVENVDELPLANYDDIDFSLYLTPRTVLPYQSSRGCHYGQCAFCNHDAKYRHNYRSKTPQTIVQDLMTLNKKYDVWYFQFVDEAIESRCFIEMINEMDKYPVFKKIKWFYYSRVSRFYTEEVVKKAKENGCEMVMFGVETFDQRLLKIIKKGITAETSEYCLKLFHNAGIKAFAWLMCNLPTETEEDTRRDIEKLKSLLEYVDCFCVGRFCLQKNTDMYKEPEKYNIIEINPDDETLFISHNDGQVVNSQATLEIYKKEYSVLMWKCFFTIDRYLTFFDGLI